MKALFIHCIRMKRDKKENMYTHSSYNSNVWKRYLDICDELSVIASEESRIYEEDYARQKFEPFDTDAINYIKISDIYDSVFSFLNPIKRVKNKTIIKENVLSHDFVIARLPSFAGYEAIKYAEKLNKPYIVEVVACSWDALWNHSLKGKVLAPISFLREKKHVRKAPYVVYVTNGFLQGRYPTYGKYVNCSNVTLNDFCDKVIIDRIEKIRCMDRKDKIIIGTIAAVDVRYKGQQFVIKALGRLKRQGLVNYEYQLVGGGDQTYLKSVAKKYNVTEQVKFLGSIPHDKVFEWLDSIDIYVQPSRQEGLPRALIEAMSRGVPAFGAKTGGIPELLEPQLIFRNTRRNVYEICNIIKLFDIDTMISQAKRNYEEAKKYDKEIIEERRKNFFIDFVKKET